MAGEIEIALNVEHLMTERRINQAELAKRLGVSKTTVSSYTHNRWKVLDRDVLERMARIFQCEVGALIWSEDARFLTTLKTTRDGKKPSCWFLRRPDADSVEDARSVGLRDNQAADKITEWLQDAIDPITIRKKAVITLEDFENCAIDNCIILGSPAVNPASEMAICRAFDTKLSPSKAGKVPFQFIGLGPDGRQSSLVQPSKNGKRGIYLQDEQVFLEMNFWPREEFRAREIKKGRDCAVIVVMNHKPPGQSEMRKLVVLAGSGGVGTESAAEALVDDYRDLEPLAKERIVWGVIEAYYNKQPHSTSRQTLPYRWRARYGGRRPMAFTEKKNRSAFT